MTEAQGAELLQRIGELNTEVTDLAQALEQQHAWNQLGLGWLFIALCAVVFFLIVLVFKRG